LDVASSAACQRLATAVADGSFSNGPLADGSFAPGSDGRFASDGGAAAAQIEGCLDATSAPPEGGGEDWAFGALQDEEGAAGRSGFWPLAAGTAAEASPFPKRHVASTWVQVRSVSFLESATAEPEPACFCKHLRRRRFEGSSEGVRPRPSPPNPPPQVQTLSGRLVRTAARHPMLLLLQYSGCFFLAVCVGFIFYDLDADL